MQQNVPTVPQQQATNVYDSTVTELFFQAVIYDQKGDRFLVVDVHKADGEAIYTIANNLEHTIQITDMHFGQFVR